MSTYTIEPLQAPASSYPSTFLQASMLASQSDPTVKRLKNLYKAPHQAEFLYLQAEVDSLLRQLETALAQRQAEVN